MKKKLILLMMASVMVVGSTLPPHSGQTLMKLAKRKKVQPLPPLPVNAPPVIRFVDTDTATVVPPTSTRDLPSLQLPSSASNHLWSLLYSTNLVTWTLTYSNLAYSTATNIGLTYTNNKAAEFWRLRQQTNYIQ